MPLGKILFCSEREVYLSVTVPENIEVVAIYELSKIQCSIVYWPFFTPPCVKIKFAMWDMAFCLTVISHLHLLN